MKGYLKNFEKEKKKIFLKKFAFDTLGEKDF